MPGNALGGDTCRCLGMPWMPGDAYGTIQLTVSSLQLSQEGGHITTSEKSVRDLCERTKMWLRELGPAWCNIKDLSVVGSCTNLISLDLTQCREIKDLSPLSSLSSLRSLKLLSHVIESLDILPGLSQLTLLDLAVCTQLTNLNPLSSMNHLRELHLDNLGLVTSLSSLSPLSGLEVLFLDYMVSLSSLTPLTGLTRLKQLSLAYLNIEDIAPLQNMTRLERLDLIGTDVMCIVSLTNLCNLWELHLGQSTTSLDPLSCLTNLLDVLVQGHENGLFDSVPLPYTSLKPLSYCTALKQLDISDCTLFDLSPLASCLDLRRLYTTDDYKQQVPWLMRVLPRVEVFFGDERDEWLDARSL